MNNDNLRIIDLSRWFTEYPEANFLLMSLLTKKGEFAVNLDPWQIRDEYIRLRNLKDNKHG